MKSYILSKWHNFGEFLIKSGYRILGFHENYDPDSPNTYCVVNGEYCGLCRNCGSPIQTTSAICGNCYPAARDAQKNNVKFKRVFNRYYFGYQDRTGYQGKRE